MFGKNPNIAVTNELIKEMTGVTDLRFSAVESIPMNRADRLLSCVLVMDLMTRYVATGSYVDDFLKSRGMKKTKLNAKWWNQFAYIRSTAANKYARHSMYFVAASKYIAEEGDSERIAAGDVNAHSRLGLVIYCSWLIAALHPEANHSFFKALIEDAPEYVTRRSHPKFDPQPDLTPEEMEQIREAASGLRAVYNEDPSRDPAEILCMYVAQKYSEPIICQSTTAEEAPAPDPAPIIEPIEPPAEEQKPVEKSSFTPDRFFSRLGKTLVSISDPDHQFSFDPRPGSPSYVHPLPREVMEKLVFDEQTGQLSSTDTDDEALKKLHGVLENRITSETIKHHDFLMLRTALTAVYRNPETIDLNYVTVKRTELGKHLGINLAAGNTIDVIARMRPLENLIGRTTDGSWWRVFVCMGYNQDIDAYTFACPFINRIVLNLEESSKIRVKTKANDIIQYKAPKFNFLLHSNIAKERNKRAVEIVTALTNLLLQRAGQTTKKKNGETCFRAHIKYSTLIGYCSDLVAYLQECKDTSNKNKALKSAFTKAREILFSKTDAPLYFNDLTVPVMLPTCNTIDQVIEITFSGINTKFKKED